MSVPVDKACKERVWITPESILRHVREHFGGSIALDPATEPSNPTAAATFYTEEDNGLSKPWFHGTFVNPPYGREMREWARKICTEARRGCEIVALLPPTRGETRYWQESIFIDELNALCFVRGRVNFLRPSGEEANNNVYGSVLYGFNVDADEFSSSFRELGTCIGVELLG